VALSKGTPMTSPSRWLTEPESISLLKAYGLPFLSFGVARSAEEAQRLAVQWPEPLVLKVVSRGIRHKTDVGGVRLGVRRSEINAAYGELIDGVSERVAACKIEGILVQPQAETGAEVMIGVKRDSAFGHIVLFGAGGVLTELLDEVSLRMLPIDRFEARKMVFETRVVRILEGMRGGTRGDIEAVCDILTRLSLVVEEHPDILEMDLNPVVVHTGGATAVDALIKLELPSSEH